MVAQPARDREHRRDHRTALAGQLDAAVDPRRAEAQHLLERGDATLRHADADARARVGRHAVDVRRLEAGVGDGLLGGVDRQRDGVDHQPAADLRHADAGDGDVVLELRRRASASAGRTWTSRVDGGERALLGVAGGLEQRDPHVVVVLEAHLHLHADEHVAGLAADDVGGEADAVVLLDGDDRDHVRRREAREPGVLVDR